MDERRRWEIVGWAAAALVVVLLGARLVRAQAAEPAPPAPISLATATVAQLDTLDGIGPTIAGRIVEYRTEHGGFRSVGELKQVDGIGEKRFETLREGLTP